jgi:hypothetical protein
LQDKIATGISIPKNLKDKIDLDRGDISRSKYILRILENVYGGDESNKNNALNESRRKPQAHSAAVNASSTSKSGSDLQVG